MNHALVEHFDINIITAITTQHLRWLGYLLHMEETINVKSIFCTNLLVTRPSS